MSEVQVLEATGARASSEDAAVRYDDHQALLEDLYDDQLLTDCYQLLTNGRVEEGMHALVGGLGERRANSSDNEWKDYVKICMLHPIRELIHQDPFTARAFTKPRGYAGDAELLDFIYGVDKGEQAPEGSTPLGSEIFKYTTISPACCGVRDRARWVAEMVDRIAIQMDRPEILSIAAGHLREADMSGALKQRRLGRWVAFDADVDSMQEVHRCYHLYGVETIAGTVRQVLSGKANLGEFDFIYSTGLYDYLRQSTGKRLTTTLFDQLRPGGHLLIANFLPDVFDRGYMTSFMDWHLIFRNHSEMLDLAMALDQTKVKDIHLTAEDHFNVVFLHVTKKA